MNPRLFCRERAFHKALLLTYSFDPIFFEQVVLPDLWAGRASDILVLGDKNQVDASIHSAAGQLGTSESATCWPVPMFLEHFTRRSSSGSGRRTVS